MGRSWRERGLAGGMLVFACGIAATRAAEGELGGGGTWSALWSYDEDARLSLFGIKAAGDDWRLHGGGRLVVDAIKYGHANARRSGLEVDEAQLLLEGGYGEDLAFRVQPDLLGIDTRHNLYDAWASLRFCPEATLTAGQIRLALGTEYATRPEDLPLIGYGFTSFLDGRHDWGARLDGELLARSFWYDLAAVAGHGFGVDGQDLNSPQFSLRCVVTPFAATDLPALQGFFGGAGLAYSPRYDDPLRLTTPLDSTVFTVRDLDGDDAFWRHLELGYFWGPFRCGFESSVGAVGDVPTGGGRTEDMDQLTAWTAYAAWNLTGEETAWRRGRWVPAPAASSRFGRVEIAARYSNADVDRGLFDGGLTDYDPSTQEVRTFTLNLNWYPAGGVRVSAGWVKTLADDELTAFGGTNRDSALLLRLALDL